MCAHRLDVGLMAHSPEYFVVEYISKIIESADNIKVTDAFYVIPCKFGSVIYPRNSDNIILNLNSKKMSEMDFEGFVEFIIALLRLYQLYRTNSESNELSVCKEKLISKIDKKPSIKNHLSKKTNSQKQYLREDLKNNRDNKKVCVDTPTRLYLNGDGGGELRRKIGSRYD